MKAFVAFFALATVALAAPEADPQLVYAAGYPAVYASPHATAGLTTYANGAVVPTDTLSVQAAKAQHFAAKAFDYATRPVYGYYGAHILAKREAEAEADAQFYYSPYYASPHASLGLTAYPNGAVTPTETLAVQAAKAQHFAAKASVYATQPYYGYYGAHYLAKREAEAEPKADADAQYFYSAGYPYYANYGFVNNYAYPYRFIGKREAEAEPKADAQFLAYGGYGYPYATYGAYRGYYGYPYATAYLG